METNQKEAWLQARKQGIGGSDIACLVGQNPFKTAFELWHEKTSTQDERAFDEASIERMYWGVELENLVAQRYSKDTGTKVQRINKMMKHPTCPIAIANIDRAVVTPGSRVRWCDKEQRLLGADKLLEVKTAHALASNSEDWGEAGTDEVPINYWYQCLWYMGITGVHQCDLAVLFGGQRFRIYTIEYDEEVFKALLQRASEWWNKYIITGIAPDPHDEAEAKLKWKKSETGKELIAGVDIADLIYKLKDVNSKIALLDDEKKALRDKLVPLLEDAEIITHQGEKIATYKSNKDNTVTDWKAAYLSLSTNPEHIEQFQSTKTGARVLRLN